MPKLTYFTTGLGRGGAEIQCMLLVEQFVRAGWDVQVISLLQPLDFEKELADLGVPLVNLKVSKRFPNPLFFLRLVQALRARKPDILHCHQVHANLLGRLARLFVSIPAVICTAHNTWEGPRWREWAYRLTDPLCDLTTQVSQLGLDRYIEIGAAPVEKICYVRNAIDTARLSPDSSIRLRTRDSLGVCDDDFVWLAAGNLRGPKDYPNMLAAFEVVHSRRPDARLLIAGGGALRAELEQRAAERNLTRAVRFLGTRPDVDNLMRAADGFLLSSSFEGFPLVILEACSLELPIASTSVGGIPEILREGETGYLAPPHDPAALAEACLRLMRAAPADRARMGRQARRTVVASFSTEAVMERWQQIYSQISTQARPRALERGVA